MLSGQEQSSLSQNLWSDAHGLTCFRISAEPTVSLLMPDNYLMAQGLSIIPDRGISVAGYQRETYNKDRSR